MSRPDWLAAWERGAAFTVGVTSDGSFGNGLAVDARTIVTCAHVACDRATRPRLASETEPDWTVVVGEWDRRRWPITIDKGNDAVPVSRLRIHRQLDLAVLDLERPMPGRRVPLLQAPAALHGRAAWVPFVTNQGEPGICDIPALPVQFRSSTRRSATTQVNLGLPEGTSGSGVFVEIDGSPALAALVERGGIGSAVGRFIAADAVIAFLAECGRVPMGRPSGNAARELWADGVCAAPIDCVLPDDPAATFVPLGIVGDARVWMARDAISDLSAENEASAHPLTRATNLTRDEARAIIARLDEGRGLAAGLQPRLPTKDEMMRAHDVAFGRVNLPGPDEAEWVDDAGIAALRHDPRSRPPFAAVYDERRSSTIGFRLVLEEKLA